jgi:hypothetical protein
LLYCYRRLFAFFSYSSLLIYRPPSCFSARPNALTALRSYCSCATLPRAKRWMESAVRKPWSRHPLSDAYLLPFGSVEYNVTCRTRTEWKVANRNRMESSQQEPNGK